MHREKTPHELGYSMPAEWERHDSAWLAWPHGPTTFPEIEKVEKTYVQIIDALHESESVNLLVKDAAMKTRASEMLNEKDVDLAKIHFAVLDYADVWIRDYGPIFVVNKEKKPAMLHWFFNAWGGKYEELIKDTRIPEIINKRMNLRYFKPGIVLEGGSIDVNGRGTLLTTEQCLLNKNRNLNLGKEEIEQYLKDYLGVSNIIWLKKGIAGDDTDGHVDDIARFVDPKTVLCAYEEDENDENYAALKENYEILLESRAEDGNGLRVIKLPMPGSVGGEERLPASYANFYIGNKVVLVPVFGHEKDKRALKIIQEVFPDRKAAGIDCTDLVYGFGAIHCITQQQPACE
jgi:agmatine deiminase